MNNTTSPAQVYQPPSKALNPAEDPSKEAVRQCCGYTIAILFSLGSVGQAANDIRSMIAATVNVERIYYAVSAIGFFTPAIFYFSILRSPSYLAGKPARSKFWPYYLSIIFKIVAIVLIVANSLKVKAASNIVVEIVLSIIMILIYGIDDSSNSGCLCFKPWIYKTKMIPYGVAYPPQGQMAPGGYPPQAYQAPMPGACPPQPQV